MLGRSNVSIIIIIVYEIYERHQVGWINKNIIKKIVPEIMFVLLFRNYMVTIHRLRQTSVCESRILMIFRT